MKFLLFFVSIIFSVIFYIFYSLTKWRDIFWEKISNSYNFVSFSGNLLIESFVFVLLSIMFLYLFSNLKEKWSNKIKNYKTEIFYFIFYIILIFYIYFFNKNINLSIAIIIIFFIIWDMIFNHISNIYTLINQKIKLRYIGLVINYIVSLLSILYIYKNNISILSFIPILILIFNIYFNILIHKKYINYISLFFSLFTILFLFYNLFFLIIKLYFSYI